MATVKTRQGMISGGERGGVHSFLGIPYARPPIGGLRFHPPLPAEPWAGIRPGTAYGPIAKQNATPGPIGEAFAPRGTPGDNFLNLNVWTPDPATSGLPVHVYIHGGGFVIGAGSDEYCEHGAVSYARDGIVGVSINYRLGAQGFLHVDDSTGAGNFGMLDQIAALMWVQENIKSFGGDPSKVTISGVSAGGMSVGTLLAMPAARGLFRRAIAQSGASHNGMSVSSASLVAGCVQEAAGVRGSDALRALAIDDLLAAEKSVHQRVMSREEPRLAELCASALPMSFQPTHGTEHLPERPIDAVRAGSARGVDVLVGNTTEEMLPLLRLSSDSFGVPRGHDLPPAAAEAIAAMAFAASGKRPADVIDTYRRSGSGSSVLELVAAVSTDWIFRMPAIRLAEAHSKHGRAFLYDLAWDSPGAGGEWAAGHGLDVPLVFDACETDVGRYVTGGKAPRELIEAMHDAWSAFIKNGNPGWPAYDGARRSTMRFDVNSRVIEDPDTERRKLWDGVI